MKILNYEQIADKIIEIRDQKVILDSDVADFYGVETKRINEAVTRNPEKFPLGYLIELKQAEWIVLKSQFAISIQSKGGKIKTPKAFTEKGLYMLGRRSDQANLPYHWINFARKRYSWIRQVILPDPQMHLISKKYQTLIRVHLFAPAYT